MAGTVPRRRPLLDRMPRRPARILARLGRAAKTALQGRLFWRDPTRPFWPTGMLHINACGDFTLLARSRWEALRGYPEMPIFSWHLDSVLCFMAHYASLREVILPWPVFHVEHGGGWTPQAARDKTLDRRLAASAIPRLTDADLRRIVAWMRSHDRPAIYNDESWGMAQTPLAETAP